MNAILELQDQASTPFEPPCPNDVKALGVEKAMFKVRNLELDKAVYDFATKHELQPSRFDTSKLEQWVVINRQIQGKSAALPITLPKFAVINAENGRGSQIDFRLWKDEILFGIVNSVYPNDLQAKLKLAYSKQLEGWGNADHKKNLNNYLKVISIVTALMAVWIYLGGLQGIHFGLMPSIIIAWIAAPFMNFQSNWLNESLTAQTRLPGMIPNQWRTVIHDAIKTFPRGNVFLIIEAEWQLSETPISRNLDPLVVLELPENNWYVIGAFDATLSELELS
jgi:hypothetical protein